MTEEQEKKFRDGCRHYKFKSIHNSNKQNWKEQLLSDITNQKQNNSDLIIYICNITNIDYLKTPITPNITIYISEFEEFVKYIENYIDCD